MTAYKPMITVDERGAQIIVLREGDKIPALVHGLVTRKEISREVVRLIVGAKYIDPAISAGIIPSFLEALKVYDGDQVIRTAHGSFWSGGTANSNPDGTLKDDMPTVLPGHIAAAYPTIAFSTTPKTASVLAQNYTNGGIVVDNWGTRLDYRQHLSIVYEPNITTPADDWDYDLPLYLGLMKGWMRLDNPFLCLGICANGGMVARREFYGAINAGIPLIMLRGSMRETDAFIAAFEHDDWSKVGIEERLGFEKKRDADGVNETVKEKMEAALAKLDAELDLCRLTLATMNRDLVTIVPINDSKALNTALLDRGFLSEPEVDADEDPNS